MNDDVTLEKVEAEVVDTGPDEETIAEILNGDISNLDTRGRNQFLWRLAKGLGLNPLTKPFDLIVLNNKLTVYANRTASDQLAHKHGISVEVLYDGPLVIGSETRDDVYCVKMKLTDKEGRTEFSVGCVGIARLQGEALGNAIMKCFTKCKRRGVLAMRGLGFLDELEVASIASVAEERGLPGPRRIVPPADASASPQQAAPNGAVQVTLPPRKGPA